MKRPPELERPLMFRRLAILRGVRRVGAGGRISLDNRIRRRLVPAAPMRFPSPILASGRPKCPRRGSTSEPCQVSAMSIRSTARAFSGKVRTGLP
jgi:hypothetical protein